MGFFGRRGNQRHSGAPVDSVIGPGSRLCGTLESEGTLRVDGYVEGDLISKGGISVGPQAVVVGNLKAKDVSVSGKVIGDVIASGKLEVLSTGSLQGDIETDHLVVENGGLFIGRCAMMEKGGKSGGDVTGPPQAPQSEEETRE